MLKSSVVNFSYLSVKKILTEHKVDLDAHDVYERYFLSNPDNMNFVIHNACKECSTELDIQYFFSKYITEVLCKEGIVKGKHPKNEIEQIADEYIARNGSLTHYSFSIWMQRQHLCKLGKSSEIWNLILSKIC